MKRRRYQLSIGQMMLLILLGTVWAQLHVSWHTYDREIQLARKLAEFGRALKNHHAADTIRIPPEFFSDISD